MPKRPSLSLCVIAKNEAHNIPILFESVKDCFDEIYLTDTGSTDDTVEVAKKHGAIVSHFDWVHDFSQARNFNFSQSKTDYSCWLDLDDVLHNREAFIDWRNDSMGLAPFWVAIYDYASNEKGPFCSFIRERVIKNGMGFKWRYFLHEGITPKDEKQVAPAQKVESWKVVHRRSSEDMKADKRRNLNIFEKHLDKLDARMTFYYGKELMEYDDHMKGYTYLQKAVDDPSLAEHDRILCLQYLAHASMKGNDLHKCIQWCLQGLHLDSSRAEFHSIIGDSWIKLGRLDWALPWYQAAKNCVPRGTDSNKFASFIFSYPDAYGVYPSEQVSRIYANMGRLDLARDEAKECFEKFQSETSKKIMDECQTILSKTVIPKKESCVETNEIVITTPPVGAYEWDEAIYKEKGMGGSETAAIEMASWIRKLTDLPVIIFNQRKTPYLSESGVQYRPCGDAPEYFSKFYPKLHIAWRHNTKLTNAPTYLWCHDLQTPGAQYQKNWDKILTLTPFHKRYIMGMQGLKDVDFMQTSNGIDPTRFEKRGEIVKNKYKVIWPSSPDRGLDRAMYIMDKVVKVIPKAELHVFYGMDNLRKYGLGDMASNLEIMMGNRTYVKYHGFTEQKELARHFMESSVWLYPANFIESFCITVLESLSSHCWPVVKEVGALQDTLREASMKGMCDLLDLGIDQDHEFDIWASHVINAINEEKWKKMEFDPKNFSWENVARQWIETFNLPLKKELTLVSL